MFFIFNAKLLEDARQTVRYFTVAQVAKFTAPTCC